MSARELESFLHGAPRDTVQTIVDFLTSGFGWSPRQFDRHDDATRRLCELVEDGRVSVIRTAISGHFAGSVPLEGEGRRLSELVEEPAEEDAFSTNVSVESPMIIETSWSVEPPPMPEFDVEFEPAAAPEPSDASTTTDETPWVEVVDTHGNVFVGAPIRLEFSDGAALEGVLDHESGLSLDRLAPAHGDSVTLTFPQGLFG